MTLIWITWLLISFPPPVRPIASTEYWDETVEGTAPFRSLSSQCSKNCILGINHKINPPDGCETYGCVCSENASRGTNLIAAYNEAQACVRENCEGDSPVQAGSVLRSICSIVVNLVPPSASDSVTVSTSIQVVTKTVDGKLTTEVTTVVKSLAVSQTAPAAVPTQTCKSQSPGVEFVRKINHISGSESSFINRITPPSYGDLNNGCSRFVLNGCRDGYGNYDEPNCGPFKTPNGWQQYKGLSHALGACTAFDICAGSLYFIALSAAYNASSTFCNYKPSANGSVDNNWDQVLGAVSDYCAQAGLGQSDWQYHVVGEEGTEGKLDEHEFCRMIFFIFSPTN